MPRETYLRGYAPAVRRTEVQEAGDDGLPLFDGKGRPRMVQAAEIALFCPVTGETLIFALAGEGLERFKRDLNGGIVQASSLSGVAG